MILGLSYRTGREALNDISISGIWFRLPWEILLRHGGSLRMTCLLDSVQLVIACPPSFWRGAWSLVIQCPRIICHAIRMESGRPYTSSAVIIRALPQPANNKNHPSFHFPIRFLELVNWRRGNIENGSWIARTTWLRVSRSVTLLSPRNPMITTAGIIASERVISRRSHGL